MLRTHLLPRVGTQLRRYRRTTAGSLLALILVVLVALATPARPAAAQSCQTFPETGFSVCGRLLEFWRTNGGLAVFGYPIGPQKAMQIGDWSGQGQWFERNRLELHPENARPYDVLLGQLGTEARGGADAPASQDEGVTVGLCTYFPETGHNLCGDFWGYWSSYGVNVDGRGGISAADSLALFGYPISEVVQEPDANGVLRDTQYFERAVLRAFPENQPPYTIQGDLLGVLSGNGG